MREHIASESAALSGLGARTGGSQSLTPGYNLAPLRGEETPDEPDFHPYVPGYNLALHRGEKRPNSSVTLRVTALQKMTTSALFRFPD